MNVINSVKEYVTTVFDLGNNPTEAIDVVAIQHNAPDQQVRTTPFYVRFETTKYHERRVEVFVNGEQARDVYMELDSNGEAYFAHAIDQECSDTMEPMFFTDFGDPPSNPSSATSNSFSIDFISSVDPIALKTNTKFTENMRTPSVYFDALHSAPPSVEKAGALQKTSSDYFDVQSDIGLRPSATSTDFGDPSQPIEVDSLNTELALSLCGDMLSTADSEGAAAIFRKHQVSEEDFRRSGVAILQDPALRVRVHGAYHRYDLHVQALLVSNACFPPSSSRDPCIHPSPAPQQPQPSPPSPAEEDLSIKPRRHTIDGPTASFFMQPAVDQFAPRQIRGDADRAAPSPASRWLGWFKSSPRSSSSTLALPTDDAAADNAHVPATQQAYHRCVYPSEAQLGRMQLVYGPNTVEFRVKSKVYGEDDLSVSATLFLWHASTKLVVADIDFTVSCDVSDSSFLRTSSSKYDVADGAPDFFSHVLHHGYQLIYLSSRNPVDSRDVLDFLPRAPLLGAFGLFASDNDQVALKLSMLQELQGLYPPDVNPFYAALTNANHADAFLHSGLHPGKVLVMDSTTGRFRLAHQKVLKATDTSYANLRDSRTFDMMFPPVFNVSDAAATTPTSAGAAGFAPAREGPSTFHEEAFNDMNFWRLPPPRL